MFSIHKPKKQLWCYHLHRVHLFIQLLEEIQRYILLLYGGGGVLERGLLLIMWLSKKGRHTSSIIKFSLAMSQNWVNNLYS